jgi:hypothetical protein
MSKITCISDKATLMVLNETVFNTFVMSDVSSRQFLTASLDYR